MSGLRLCLRVPFGASSPYQIECDSWDSDTAMLEGATTHIVR